MAIQIKDTVIQTTAIDSIRDNLLNAKTATGGAISVGRNIHKGDYIEETFFDDFGNIVRRDPTVDTAVTPERLSTSEDVAVKLYFRGDLFVTNTELERYGTTVKNMNSKIGNKIGEKISRWTIEKGLIALVAALTSRTELVAGDGTTAADVQTLADAVFKLGDMNEDVKVFVAPSMVAYQLLQNALNSTADQISYGAVYGAQIGTLGRKLWMVDNAALQWSEDLNGDGVNENGYYTLGLTPGAITIDESEVVKILSDLDITQENAGYRFKAEGAYTIKVKGFSYNKAQGINPSDSVLGSTASWTLVSDIKAAAGVVAKTA
ncbi:MULTISPECIES: major capsid protein [unclassified Nitratiruptor]|uniref:major capsid protein n=1 Tax=unclassified Nitratiruptor TaxID=2624044 RepID=UPI0019166CCF|nr:MULTISPECIES: major capsid protein [unclassified Nitratiruptor]BCD59628.1 major capsid protein [Nitratiruptor sp. YY08-10]BCD63552.1 major capsid protein [Nitratiruptor sp. YY08-14]BCD83104.1 major capsid protein [Nitratiruptor phage NrS-2]BCD83170.1 major capsid protein [Nitratiruptor phage NrS-3]